MQVIEKLARNHSSCVRPGLPNYVTEPETATFQLTGQLKTLLAGKQLQVSEHASSLLWSCRTSC